MSTKSRLQKIAREVLKSVKLVTSKTVLALFYCLSYFGALQAQQVKLQVDGAIQIANSEDPTPDPGTSRWTGMDFEGWNGKRWGSLTGYATLGTVTGIDGNFCRNKSDWQSSQAGYRYNFYKSGGFSIRCLKT
jgi:hypothetical protein